MKKKTSAILTAMALTAGLAFPVSAASPSTSTVMNTAVTVSQTTTASRGYTMTEAETAATATTPAQAVALSSLVTASISGVDVPAGVTFGSVPANPSTLSLAKADLLKNSDMLNTLRNSYGITNASINSAGQLIFSNGASGEFSVNLEANGITSAKNVAIIVYTTNSKGETVSKVVKPTWKKGKLQASLPVPCNYVVVTK